MFSRNQTDYGDLKSKFLYLGQIRKALTENNSILIPFSRSIKSCELIDLRGTARISWRLIHF